MWKEAPVWRVCLWFWYMFFFYHLLILLVVFHSVQEMYHCGVSFSIHSANRTYIFWMNFMFTVSNVSDPMCPVINLCVAQFMTTNDKHTNNIFFALWFVAAVYTCFFVCLGLECWLIHPILNIDISKKKCTNNPMTLISKWIGGCYRNI